MCYMALNLRQHFYLPMEKPGLCFHVWSPYYPPEVRLNPLGTNPLFHCLGDILNIIHWFDFDPLTWHWFYWQSSFNKTISPTSNSVSSFFHFVLFLDSVKFSSSISSKTLQECVVHIATSFFEYTSGLLNTTGGGMTTIVFSVMGLLGESTISVF